MDWDKINDLTKQKRDKQKKYQEEQDYQKKRQLFLQIQILDLKEKIERLKKN